MAAKDSVKKKIIVRACVGCILPPDSILIGQGDYNIQIGDKNQYYDYEINQIYYEDFILENQRILMDNGLLKIIKSPEEIQAEIDKKLKENPPYISPNGYQRKIYK